MFFSFREILYSTSLRNYSHEEIVRHVLLKRNFEYRVKSERKKKTGIKNICTDPNQNVY